MKYLLCLFCVFFLYLTSVFCAEIRHNDIIQLPIYQQQHQSRGFMDNAQQLFAGPAGQMVVHFAKEMISRSAGNSQILSLNLTNLLVLVLLKALIFAAGIIGAGSWAQYARGRSFDEPMLLLKDSETPLLVGFLAAQGSGQDGCLSRAACRSPNTAAEYTRAARALLKGAEMFDTSLPYDKRYNEMLELIEKAVIEGVDGAPCEMIYPCHI